MLVALLDGCGCLSLAKYRMLDQSNFTRSRSLHVHSQQGICSGRQQKLLAAWSTTKPLRALVSHQEPLGAIRSAWVRLRAVESAWERLAAASSIH
jgi:hypothetical protein